MDYGSIPVLYVLDDNGEANGTIRFYCSTYCRSKALQTNEDSVTEGMNHAVDVPSQTRCEQCGQPVGKEN